MREDRAAPTKVTVRVPPVYPSPKTVAARIAYALKSFMIETALAKANSRSKELAFKC